MKKINYESTVDYQKSVAIVKGFVKEVLNGDIEKLRTFDFSDLTSYIGEIYDPDMYLISQAIYIVLWGDIYDLTFEKIGQWNSKNSKAFRGDTMNSFGSLFGKKDESRGRCFAFRAKNYGADKNPVLWKKIEEFAKMYHYAGNFIILPNRGTVGYGINGARAGYYDSNYCEGMRDYFDWFLIAVAEYQAKVKSGNNNFNKFEMQLQMNPEYNPLFLDIREWKDLFFLEPYYKDGMPAQLFKTPLSERLKVTDPNGKNPDTLYFEVEEYLELLEDYLDKSREVINYRTDKIIEALKEKIND